ncbi:hypothetical protein P7C73_g4241, partial [Tremellales sp. Uapishka_1]
MAIDRDSLQYVVKRVTTPEEMEKEDAKSAHFIVVLPDGQVIGVVRVLSSIGQLGRLAIKKSYRGYGLAKPLCSAVEDHMRAIGGKEVWCQSQADVNNVDATGFYERLGWVKRGDKYIKEKTIHQDMVLFLNADGTQNADK